MLILSFFVIGSLLPTAEALLLGWFALNCAQANNVFLSPKSCGKTLQISLIKSQCKVALFNKFAIARYMTIITAKISMLAQTSDFFF